MKVLLAFGGSEGSVNALERTVEHAAAAGDDLTVALVEREDTSYQQLVDHVESIVSETGLSVDYREIDGQIGSALIDIAESEEFDELVLAGGKTSPMGKITLNQTAEFVLLNSHVTVTLVR